MEALSFNEGTDHTERPSGGEFTDEDLNDILNSGSGLLWDKIWWPCTFNSILINSSSGGFQAGAIFPYNIELILSLQSNNISFTITEGKGQKSYCRNGWELCSVDECR